MHSLVLSNALHSDGQSADELHQLIDLHPDDRAMLSHYHFDERVYLENLRALRDRETLSALSDLSDLSDQDLITPPELDSLEAKETTMIGAQALRAGKLAVIVLAGGMATRFGGGVKGLVELSPGRSLLDLHAERMRGVGELVLMTSPATHQALSAWAAKREQVSTFTQGIAPRATERGEILLDDEGRASFAATGHGDLIDCLRGSGTLDRLRSAGVETLLMINVDNVAASPDPLIYGSHLLGGAALSVEVTQRSDRDRGGLTLRHRGRPRIVEDFLVPDTMDTSKVRWLNTNTLWMQLSEVDQTFPFSWITARKQIGEPPHQQRIVQFERLIGELSAFVPTRFLTVKRSGAHGRFLPIKSASDLPEAITWVRTFASSP